MSELEILLTQVERTDCNSVQTILDGGLGKLLISPDIHTTTYHKWFDELLDANTFNFAIRAKKIGDFKSFLVGVCGIIDIDWIARHGQIFFFMVDKDGHRATLQNHPATLSAAQQLFKYAFDDLNLNKIWIEVLESNDIKSALEHFGFIGEGIRRKSIFRDGAYMNTIICSITYDEYCNKVDR